MPVRIANREDSDQTLIWVCPVCLCHLTGNLCLKLLTLCLLGNLHAFSLSVDVFQSQFCEKKFFQEYHRCQAVWIPIRPDGLSVLIWIQTVCRDYEQSGHVVAPKFQPFA